MPKVLVRDIILLLPLMLLCTAERCIGQLQIGSGTTWVSTSDTYAVLDDLGIQHNASPVLLNNVFRFTGSHMSVIGGSTQPYFNAISFAKSNPGKLALSQSVNIGQRIHFETGFFDLNGNDIYLDSNALLSNENELSRLIGPSGGTISINIDLPAPVAANPGNLGAFVSSATGLGRLNIVRGHQPQSINDSSLGIARYYDLAVNDNVSLAANLRFYYFDAESAGFDNDSLVLWKSADAIKWTDIGYTSRDATGKYVEKQGLNSFNRFTLYPSSASSTPPTGPPSTPVPGVPLLTGSWVHDLAQLNWIVLSEYQTDHFSIERKYSSETGFTAISSVPTTAPGGTTSSPSSYSFTDSTVKTGPDDVSYRIHEIGSGGQSLYSNVITLKATGSEEFIHRLYPTIAIGGRVYVKIGNMRLQQMSFVIIDTKGSIVLTGTLPYQSQWLPVNFLSKGHYHLVLRSGDKKFHSTFIK